MKAIIEEYGGVLACAAVIIVLIAAIVLIGKSGLLDGLFTTLINAFTTKAQGAAGF